MGQSRYSFLIFPPHHRCSTISYTSYNVHIIIIYSHDVNIFPLCAAIIIPRQKLNKYHNKHNTHTYYTYYIMQRGKKFTRRRNLHCIVVCYGNNKVSASSAGYLLCASYTTVTYCYNNVYIRERFA